MKIILIDPRYGLEQIGGSKQSFGGVLNKIPSLGLAYLAAVAERKGHAVKIIDSTLGVGDRELAEIVTIFNPGIIGITATTPTFENAASIASVLRKVAPDAVYVCGGAHPTASPVGALENDAFNFLVLGEGEDTFFRTYFLY